MTGWSGSREKENFKPALLGHDIETTIASAALAVARLDNDVAALSKVVLNCQ